MENLKAEGFKPKEIAALIDGEAAAMILRDFLDTNQNRVLVSPSNTPDQDTKKHG